MNAPLHQNEHDRLALLAQVIRPGGRMLRAWPLAGGASTQVTAFEVALPNGGLERLVARCHGSADRLGNLNVAADEFALLAVLARAGVPAPRPRFLDQTGEVLGTPGMVVEYIEGSTEIGLLHEQEIVIQMASYLSHLHGVDWNAYDLSFLPNLNGRIDRTLMEACGNGSASPLESRILTQLAARWPLTHLNDPVLLHGDFWPGNVLWHERQIVSAIDWEDALTGDPLFDVASTCLELYWLFGDDVMEQFTAQYVARTRVDVRHLVFWELFAALDPLRNLSVWGHAPELVRDMRAKLNIFVDRALAQLTTTPKELLLP